MTKQELNELVEDVIRIRDDYSMSRRDRDTLATVCNLIDENIDALAERRE